MDTTNGWKYENKQQQEKTRMDTLKNGHKQSMEQFFQQIKSYDEEEDAVPTADEKEQMKLLQKATKFRKLLESLDDIGDASTSQYYQPITDEMDDSMHTLRHEHK